MDISTPAMTPYWSEGMRHVEDDAGFQDFILWLNDANIVTFDVETTGFDVTTTDTILGCGFGNTINQWFVEDKFVQEDPRRLDLLNTALEWVPELTAHNLKFDLSALEHSWGYISPIEQVLSDTLTMARMTMFEKKPDLSLKDLLSYFFSPSAAQYDYKFKSLIRQGTRLGRFDSAGYVNLGIYCMNDVKREAELYEFLSERIKQWDVEELWRTSGQRLTRVLYSMEREGIGVDGEYCRRSIAHIDERCKVIEDEINEVVKRGEELNLNKDTELEYIFHSLGVHSTIKSDKTHKELWNEVVLSRINHKFANTIREWRTLQKLKGTYLVNFLKDHDEMDGAVHPEFKSYGTVTGRLSATKNVQTLPPYKMTWDSIHEVDLEDEDAMEIANEMAKALIGRSGADASNINEGYLSWLSHQKEPFDESKHISVKRALIPRPGYTLVGFDWSQIEYRVLFGFLQNDQILHDMLDRAWDAHAWVANLVWGVGKGHPAFASFRRMAKCINFGIVYGMGIPKLAASIGKTEKEAKQFKQEYFDRMPEMKNFQDKIRATLEKEGWVYNHYGRKYFTPPFGIYKLTNYIVQGTAADFVNDRLCALFDFLLDKRTKILSQIHDEIIFEVHNDELPWILPYIKAIMEEKIFMDMPLYSDLNFYKGSLVDKAEDVKVEDIVKGLIPA